jgi:simple sugar transport system ATP-binding protein
MGEPFIAIKNMEMKFGSFVANDDINLEIRRGEIHAIVGENGAGKSTLMKVLYGVNIPTRGEIFVDGKKTDLHPPAKAIAAGIGMVFQDFRLVPAFTALENILLALPKKAARNQTAVRNEILTISAKYQIPVDPDMYVWEMDLGQRQRVEIIKVLLMKNTRLLIFDEPTSVLVEHEAEVFVELLRTLKADGYGILFITHKLHEVMECADRITVLRQGKITNVTLREEGFRRDVLVKSMMGEEVAGRTLDYAAYKNDPQRKAEYNFVCRALDVGDDHGREIIRNIHLEIQEGEIYGLAGISGRGQRELLETVFGIRSVKGGVMYLRGDDITLSDIKTRLDRGMSFISEDPIRDNMVPGLSICEHMPLGGVPLKTNTLSIDWKAVADEVNNLESAHVLGIPDIKRKMETLSGGNVQRVVLSRAVAKVPMLLLASYPSRGLDVGTVMAVHNLLLWLKQAGCSILLVSEDLGELFDLSDHLGVIADNTIYGPYVPGEVSLAGIGDIMLGGSGAA